MSSQKHRSQIGEGGRRLLFVGLAVLPMSVLTYALSTTPLERLLERALGTTGLGCFIYGTFMVFVVLSMLLYNHILSGLLFHSERPVGCFPSCSYTGSPGAGRELPNPKR